MVQMFITKELVEATVQERLREAALLQRQHEASARPRPRGATQRLSVGPWRRWLRPRWLCRAFPILGAVDLRPSRSS